jgi:hypothetical protein
VGVCQSDDKNEAGLCQKSPIKAKIKPINYTNSTAV